MTCPLSFILNNSDQSPPEARNRDETHNENDEDVEESSIGIAVTCSERNNSPHSRPASKALNRPLTFLTPPSGSPPAGWIETEPPPHELDFGEFSVFKALFSHSTLVFEVANYLEVDELVSIYAISKDFHDLANSHFTSMVLAQATKRAPESTKVFPFHCYRSLCQHDPTARASEKLPGKVRDVPTLRWLRMVIYREAVVDQIIECLGAEGHFMPKRASITIKKLWFMIDISTNGHRIGVIHDKNFWTDEDLYLATMFFIKLDLRFTHPTAGNGERGMRQMLLGQRSLSTLCRVLMRQELKSQLELLRMTVQWDYEPAPEHRALSILGVPPSKVGRMQYERWGRRNSTEPFILIDRLVMLEAIKRDLNIHMRYLDMITYGYIDKNTFEDVWHSSQKPPGDSDDENENENENGNGNGDDESGNEDEGDNDQAVNVS